MSSLKGGRSGISNAYARNVRVSLGARGLYLVLASYADSQTRECYPTKNTLRYVCGLSNTTLTKYLDELKFAGMIEIRRERQKGRKNLFGNNVYILKDKEE